MSGPWGPFNGWS
eukprot:symbB.v1.2.042269.t1/scaffold9623.1/size2728/1